MKKERLFYGVLMALILFTAGCSKNEGEDIVIEAPYKPGDFVEVLSSTEIDETNWKEGLSEDEQNAISQIANNGDSFLFYSYTKESIKYITTGVDGEPLQVSGTIAYPKNFSKIRGVVLAPMYTVLSNEECSSQWRRDLYSLFFTLTAGYIVITPDYIGFNITKELTHPYLHRELTGTTCADMVLAARQYMNKLKYPIDKSSIHIIGFSQGGASALAAQYIIEKQYPEIQIKDVYSGAGPHDLTATFNDYCKKKTTGFPCSVPNVVLGLNYGDNLNVNFANIFKGELLKNYGEWYNSKKYDSGEVNKFLGTKDLTKFMHADMFTDQKNDDINKLIKSCATNSNINNWKPVAPIYFSHSEDDTYVPSYNSTNAYEFFKKKGCTVRYTPLSFDHIVSGVLFMSGTTHELLKEKP